MPEQWEKRHSPWDKVTPWHVIVLRPSGIADVKAKCYTEADADTILRGHARAAMLDEAVKALELVRVHLEELREAWQRGALSEHDNLGGTRSNRNNDVLRMINARLAAIEAE